MCFMAYLDSNAPLPSMDSGGTWLWHHTSELVCLSVVEGSVGCPPYSLRKDCPQYKFMSFLS